jgi:hypothetical protein
VPYLRRRALLHLSSIYPTSLWEEGIDQPFRYLPTLDDNITALKLETEFNIPWIRPIALYACMLYDIGPLVDSFEARRIEKEDLKVCLAGKHFLAGLKAEWEKKTPFLLREDCRENSMSCSPVARRLVGEHVARLLSDDVDVFAGPHPSDYSNRGLCVQCETLFREEITEERYRRFERYGEKFADMTWGELQILKALALQRPVPST